jgi:hypothetical protein
MDLPEPLTRAAGDRRGGATEIALAAADGLLQVAGDPARLAAGAALLEAGQPAMAPVWHLVRAARSADPAAELAALRLALVAEAEAAVATAAAWLDRRPGPVATVSHSSLVERVLAGRERAGGQRGGRAVAAVLGADALGPGQVLNATGSAALAARLPTLVVATTAKLVPAEVFDRLAAAQAGFEPVPLATLAAVALGAELLGPAEAGRRAAALPTSVRRRP